MATGEPRHDEPVGDGFPPQLAEMAVGLATVVVGSLAWLVAFEDGLRLFAEPVKLAFFTALILMSPVLVLTHDPQTIPVTAAFVAAFALVWRLRRRWLRRLLFALAFLGWGYYGIWVTSVLIGA